MNSSFTINLDDNRLLITAERKEAEDRSYNRKQTFYGKYEKSFILPDSIKTDDIHASFEDGILKVIIPKTEMVKTTKQIEIK